MHQAAGKGDIETVKQHLAAGKDVDAKDPWGQTALFYAAKGHNELVDYLISKGANVNVLDNQGLTPLNLAVLHKDTANLLRKYGAKTGEELKAEGK